METSNKKKLKLKVINGFNFPAMFQEEDVKSALNYKAIDTDLFVSTYPKCGTTWLQQICILLFNDGEAPVGEEFLHRSPFLELVGANVTESLPRPVAIKTHLPFEMVPYNPKAKYLYGMRNPKDALVSYYHHMKLYTDYEFDGDFHDYFGLWLEGEVDFGKYDHNVLSWWSHRNDDNVFIILYEDMKCDIRGSILKIAKFIGEDYYKKLENNPEILEKIVKHSEWSFMKKTTNKMYEDLTRGLNMVAEETKYDFIRKGIVGDWKTHFTAEENAIFENWFRKSFSGSEVECLWDKYEIFDYRKVK